VPWADSGALRVVGDIVKVFGEYSEALPHPDGSHRLLYAPLSPESWYEDYGRAQLVEGANSASTLNRRGLARRRRWYAWLCAYQGW
jgi:hypothetical protein